MFSNAKVPDRVKFLFQEQPKLERLTTECNFEFKGQDMLESEDLMAGKKLKLSLECRGTDIIGRQI